MPGAAAARDALSPLSSRGRGRAQASELQTDTAGVAAYAFTAAMAFERSAQAD